MQEYVLTPLSDLQNMADTVRKATGSTGTFSVSDLSSAVKTAIESGNGTGGGGSVEGCVTVTFMNGAEVLFTRPVYIGDDCPDPVTQGRIDTPTKESTAQYDYTYIGWAATDNGAADGNVLKNITADKTIYAAYAAAVRYYTVTLYDEDGTTVLYTEQVAYGSMPSYTPTKDGYQFDGWTPNAPVTGDLSYTATWTEIVVEVAEIADDWETIVASVNDGTYATKYKVGNYKAMSFGSEGTVNMQIAAINADQLADGSGKAPLTWVAMQVLDNSDIKYNPAIDAIYEYPEVPSWTADGNTWTSQNRYAESSVATATFTITATTAGTLSIGYKTNANSTNYAKLSLVVDGTAVVTNWASSTQQTKTVSVKTGQVVVVEATYTQPTAGNQHGIITFSSTGTFTTAADVQNAPCRAAVGGTEGTGTVGGWEKSNLRTYMHETIKPLIPDAVRNCLKTVTKTSLSYDTNAVAYVGTSSDEVWVPSIREIFGGSDLETSGAIYSALYYDAVTRKKTLTGSTSGRSWWCRSAQSVENMYGVAYTGEQGYFTTTASAIMVCVGFCI